jgi:hypothetical protein
LISVKKENQREKPSCENSLRCRSPSAFPTRFSQSPGHRQWRMFPRNPSWRLRLHEFDGHGGLVQTDFVVKNGAPAGPLGAFRTGENGTYSVNSDCTGTATIHFPDTTPPQEIVLMFVIVNHGRGIRTVVAALYVGPGIATMTPTPAQITSEATKIERGDHN